MSECFSIGSTVACTTCFKQNIEGEVLAFDPSTKMLILSILFNIEQNHQMVHATINSIRRWIDRHYGSQCMRFAVSFVCGENYLLAVCCNNTWIVVHRMTAWNGTHTQDVGYYYHAYHNCIYGKNRQISWYVSSSIALSETNSTHWRSHQYYFNISQHSLFFTFMQTNGLVHNFP